MLLLTLSFLIAAAAPGTSPTSEFTGNTLMVIGQLVTVVVSVAALWKSSSRQPPIEEEIHKEFVRREEWDQSGQRLHARIDETNESIKELHHEVGKGFQDVERALGRIEGKQSQREKS